GALAAPGAAASLALHYDDTTPFSTTGLTGLSTAGRQMGGRRLIPTINGGASLGTGADGAGSCGSAAGTAWSVSECGDTFTSPWSLTSTAPISSLFIDAGAGDTVFDALSGVAGSPGSAQGWPFAILGTNLWDVTATYS